MGNYYYSEGNSNLGPFTIEELRRKKLNRGTPVFCQDSGQWKPAGSMQELVGFFTDDSFGDNINPSLNPYPIKPPKTWLIHSILVTIFCCLPLGIIGIIQAI